MLNDQDSNMAANAICHAAEMIRERVSQAVWNVEQEMVQQIRDSGKLTLRDQFAMAALTGLASNLTNTNTWEKDAEQAYKAADAMLAARAIRAEAEEGERPATERAPEWRGVLGESNGDG